jgi:hypothetical protein
MNKILIDALIPRWGVVLIFFIPCFFCGALCVCVCADINARATDDAASEYSAVTQQSTFSQRSSSSRLSTR